MRARLGSAPQHAQLRGWFARFTVVGVLLVTCVWGWAGYQGSGAQAAIAGLWSLCDTSGR